MTTIESSSKQRRGQWCDCAKVVIQTLLAFSYVETAQSELIKENGRGEEVDMK